MRVKPWVVALAIGLCTIKPAFAEHPPDGYHKTVGSWTVQYWKEHTCLAYNRPGAEVDATPFNALWVIAGPAPQDIMLQVFFWPGSFIPGEDVNLRFNNGRGFTVAYNAAAEGDHSALTKTKVRFNDIRQLSEAELLTIDTPKVEQKLVFDIQHLRWVLDDLARCIMESH